MRLIETIAGTRESHGGPSRSIVDLCNALVRLESDVYLIAGEPADPTIKSLRIDATERQTFVREGRATRSFFVGQRWKEALRERVAHAGEKTLIHDHGIWLPTNHFVASFASKQKIPRVVSPRGMLLEWAMTRRKQLKRLAWFLFQFSDLRQATAFHATSEAEAEAIRRLGFPQPIAVIPNGVEFPRQLPERTEHRERRAVFIGRIHPVKGLIHFVHAWKLANPPSPWRLLIAGPDENGHASQVQQEIDALDLSESVALVGNLDDKVKWQWLVNAELIVLPSFSENFGMAMAEGMAAGLPGIASRGTPWQILQEQSMGWWVEPTKDSMALALREATNLSPADLAAKGRACQDWVVNHITWKSVAEKILSFYRWLLGLSDVRPSFVI